MSEDRTDEDRADHERGSMRLGHTGSVWCSCGWKRQQDVRGQSGDDTTRRIVAAWEQHVRASA